MKDARQTSLFLALPSLHIDFGRTVNEEITAVLGPSKLVAAVTLDPFGALGRQLLRTSHRTGPAIGSRVVDIRGRHARTRVWRSGMQVAISGYDTGPAAPLVRHENLWEQEQGAALQIASGLIECRCKERGLILRGQDDR